MHEFEQFLTAEESKLHFHHLPQCVGFRRTSDVAEVTFELKIPASRKPTKFTLANPSSQRLLCTFFERMLILVKPRMDDMDEVLLRRTACCCPLTSSCSISAGEETRAWKITYAISRQKLAPARWTKTECMFNQQTIHGFAISLASQRTGKKRNKVGSARC